MADMFKEKYQSYLQARLADGEPPNFSKHMAQKDLASYLETLGLDASAVLNITQEVVRDGTEVFKN